MERVDFVGCIRSYGEPEFPLCLFRDMLVTVGRDTIGSIKWFAPNRRCSAEMWVIVAG